MFDRDLVERVLLIARVADFRDASARALRTTQKGAGAAVSRTEWPVDAGGTEPEGSAGGNTLAAILDYLRTHHPPTA